MSRPGTRRDHDRFCRREGWSEVRDARGGAVGHHTTYELSVPDGRVPRTRVSRSANHQTYGPSLWRTILREQLEVTEDGFWECVDNHRAPDRGQETTAVPAAALPAELVHQLLRAGVPAEEIAAMTLAEAGAAMVEHWSRPQG